MKARLLAIATQRSAVMERMQNVASTSAAATKPIPSMTDRSLIRLSFRLRWTLQHARGGLILFAASLASRWQLTSDLGTAALGLARQLSRTGAARLTDACIAAERGSVSHACVPLGKSKNIPKNRTLAPLRATLVAKKPPGTLNRSHRSSDKTRCRFV